MRTRLTRTSLAVCCMCERAIPHTVLIWLFAHCPYFMCVKGLTLLKNQVILSKLWTALSLCRPRSPNISFSIRIRVNISISAATGFTHLFTKILFTWFSLRAKAKTTGNIVILIQRTSRWRFRFRILYLFQIIAGTMLIIERSVAITFPNGWHRRSISFPTCINEQGV